MRVTCPGCGEDREFGPEVQVGDVVSCASCAWVPAIICQDSIVATRGNRFRYKQIGLFIQGPAPSPTTTVKEDYGCACRIGIGWVISRFIHGELLQLIRAVGNILDDCIVR